MSDLVLSIRPEVPADQAAVERLSARAFGPGRYARTAYRLREGVAHDTRLSFTALVGTLIVGSVRMTPVRAGASPDGGVALSYMLGPVTVEPAFEGRGIGGGLIRAAIGAAREQGCRLVLLVGDEPYYRRFGFMMVKPGLLSLPGPVDPRRFLVLELEEGALMAAAGAISAWEAA
jgi:predicted N-acetyltransferase YhbS